MGEYLRAPALRYPSGRFMMNAALISITTLSAKGILNKVKAFLPACQALIDHLAGEELFRQLLPRPGEELLLRAGLHEPALVQEEHPVREPPGLEEVVGHEHDRR